MVLLRRFFLLKKMRACGQFDLGVKTRHPFDLRIFRNKLWPPRPFRFSKDPAMSTKNQAALAALYKKMPTSEIQRRIAQGQLVPAALEAAEAELVHRLAQSDTEQNTSDAAELPLPLMIAAVILMSLLSIGYAYFFSPDLLYITLIIAATSTAAICGKLFPTFGKTLGWLLVASPVGFAAWLWSDGALTMKHGDYRPLESLLAYLALFIVSVLALGIGGALITGATHKGSWSHFFKKLDDKRADILEKARKTR
jgi:hypothetical protein